VFRFGLASLVAGSRCIVDLRIVAGTGVISFHNIG